LFKFKEVATKIMGDGDFHLHKWHSNVPELEEPQTTEVDVVPSQASLTYPMLEGETGPQETKILGVPWNKTEYKLSIGFMKPLGSVGIS